MNKQKCVSIMVAKVAAISVALLVLSMLASPGNQVFCDGSVDPEQFGDESSEPEQSRDLLTFELAEWISKQAENTVEEMDAISKESRKQGNFNLRYYVRFMQLFTGLDTVAEYKDVDKLSWVSLKLDTFKEDYDTIHERVLDYVDHLEKLMKEIEDKEPLGKAQYVTDEWAVIYKWVDFIRMRVSINLKHSPPPPPAAFLRRNQFSVSTNF